MPRLPLPGSDQGTWGTILNDYLLVEHNADGTLKKSSDIASAVAKSNAAYVRPGSGIPKTDLSASVQASLDNADAAVAGTAPDATTSTNGLVRLTGHLSGTAASPAIASGVITDSHINASAAISQSKVNGLTTDLAGKANSTHAHVVSDVTGLQSALDAKANTADITPVLVLNDGDPVPPGTPTGTVIFYRTT